MKYKTIQYTEKAWKDLTGNGSLTGKPPKVYFLMPVMCVQESTGKKYMGLG